MDEMMGEPSVVAVHGGELFPDVVCGADEAELRPRV